MWISYFYCLSADKWLFARCKLEHETCGDEAEWETEERERKLRHKDEGRGEWFRAKRHLQNNGYCRITKGKFENSKLFQLFTQIAMTVWQYEWQWKWQDGRWQTHTSLAISHTSHTNHNKKLPCIKTASLGQFWKGIRIWPVSFINNSKCNQLAQGSSTVRLERLSVWFTSSSFTSFVKINSLFK